VLLMSTPVERRQKNREKIVDHLFKQSLQVALAILLTNERGPSVTDEELKALEVALRAEDFPPEAWQARFALRNRIFIPSNRGAELLCAVIDSALAEIRAARRAADREDQD